jgi:predicted DNA-binding protein (MmcQ/YjbR family)
MNIELFRDYCIAKKGVTEGFPFGEDTLVFKVMGKMFALAGAENFTYANLKCDPERALELRESYPEVQPGFHMSKKHWNSVYIDGALSDDFFLELVDESYDLIVSCLTKKLKTELAELA